MLVASVACTYQARHLDDALRSGGGDGGGTTTDGSGPMDGGGGDRRGADGLGDGVRGDLAGGDRLGADPGLGDPTGSDPAGDPGPGDLGPGDLGPGDLGPGDLGPGDPGLGDGPTMTIMDGPMGLTYGCSSFDFLVGEFSASRAPDMRGLPAMFMTSVGVPASLTLGGGTGIISGVAASPFGPSPVTITADNLMGTDDVTLSLRGIDGFVVDSQADVVDVSPGDGMCASMGGQCTLRAAIMETSSTPGLQMIQVPAGTYPVGSTLQLSAPVVIVGDVSGGTVINAGTSSLFVADVNAIEVTLRHLTLMSGGSTAPSIVGGSSVLAQPFTTLCDVTVNSASATAFHFTAALIIEASTFSGNTATLSGSVNEVIISDSTFVQNGDATMAPIIANLASSNVEIYRSTFDRNITATGLAGIARINGGNLTVRNSTFIGNVGNASLFFTSNVTASFEANTVVGNGDVGTVYTFQEGAMGTWTLLNNLIQGNLVTTRTCETTGGAFSSSGGNIFEDPTGCNPTLADGAGPVGVSPLGDNGGLTETIAIFPGGLADDGGASMFCWPTDQRGYDRPAQTVCDVGALEYYP